MTTNENAPNDNFTNERAWIHATDEFAKNVGITPIQELEVNGLNWNWESIMLDGVSAFELHQAIMDAGRSEMLRDKEDDFYVFFSGKMPGSLTIDTENATIGNDIVTERQVDAMMQVLLTLRVYPLDGRQPTMVVLDDTRLGFSEARLSFVVSKQEIEATDDTTIYLDLASGYIELGDHTIHLESWEEDDGSGLISFDHARTELNQQHRDNIAEHVTYELILRIFPDIKPILDEQISQFEALEQDEENPES